LNILVRNLPVDLTEKELLQMFLPFGKVKALNIVTDSLTGKSKGFGFVEMPEDLEAVAAIRELDGKVVLDEKLRVKSTRHGYKWSQNSLRKERPDRPRTGEGKRTVSEKKAGPRSAGDRKPGQRPNQKSGQRPGGRGRS
jgi:RNA recognition motif-containing protein